MVTGRSHVSLDGLVNSSGIRDPVGIAAHYAAEVACSITPLRDSPRLHNRHIHAAADVRIVREECLEREVRPVSRIARDELLVVLGQEQIERRRRPPRKNK